MIQPSDIHTVTDFKRRTNELLERLEKSGRPQVLTVDGHAKVVLVGVADFERLMELVAEAETRAGIRRGLADMKAGRTMSVADAEAALRKKLKSRRRA
ncbi:MAG TPA: type II toxin-antitoxin system Phd/YefM family antitoxin [Planctomycetota bacterium]|nr:type II toxin-antitoxin system Phd/YefM family antitoxin [Planctomycetota bacterium]